MISVLNDPNGLYKRTVSDANFLADTYLPDMLMFQIGNPNGFGTTIGPVTTWPLCTRSVVCSQEPDGIPRWDGPSLPTWTSDAM